MGSISIKRHHLTRDHSQMHYDTRRAGLTLVTAAAAAALVFKPDGFAKEN